MFGKENLATKPGEFTLDECLHPDALANPQRNRHQKRLQPERRIGKIAVENAVKLNKRFFVERDVVHLRQRNAALPQAILDGMFRKGRVVFLARETLLLCGGNDLPIAYQARGAIVVKCRDTKDVN